MLFTVVFRLRQVVAYFLVTGVWDMKDELADDVTSMKASKGWKIGNKKKKKEKEEGSSGQQESEILEVEFDNPVHPDIEADNMIEADVDGARSEQE